MHRRHNSLMSSTAYSASPTPSMTKCFRWSVIALIGIMLAGGIGCAPNDTETQRDATLRAASTSATTGGEPLQTSSPGSADTDTQRDPSPEATAISTTTSGESSQTPPPASDSYSDFGGSGGTMIDVSHVDAGHYAISVVIAGNDRRLASDAWKLEIFRRPGDELVFEGAGRGVAASWRGEMLIEDASWNLWIRLDVGDDASWRVMLERIGDLPPPSSQPDPTPVSTTTPPPTLTPTPTAVAPTPTPTPTAAAPTPTLIPTPTVVAPTPTPTPTPTAAAPTPTLIPTPTVVAPTPTPTPTPTAAAPTPTPTPTATVAAPTPTPTPTPTAAPPTPTATPAPTAVAATPTPAVTATAPSQPTSEDGRSALERWDTNGNGRITCAEAREHGIAPVHRDHPAYEYMDDRDNDGVVCE